MERKKTKTTIEITEEGVIYIDGLTSDCFDFDFVRDCFPYTVEYENYKAYLALYKEYKEWLECITALPDRFHKLYKLREEYWSSKKYPIWNHVISKAVLKTLSKIIGLSRRNILKYMNVKLKK